MKKIISVYKPVGVTPLQVIHTLKRKYSEYMNTKIGYAGRLDPMAEGLLLLLLGEENKQKERYEKLDKEYEFQAIFGCETDSYDLLGKVHINSIPDIHLNEEIIKNALFSFSGNSIQTYPPYSSVRVKGKPLFYWAFHNKLHEVTIPKKQVTISHLQFLSLESISTKDLQAYITETIQLVSGNFRQEEILNQWQIFFRKNTSTHFLMLKATCACSSGTYIRSLVHDLGKKLNTSATTYAIRRTRIGAYTLDSAIQLW
ncbi:MAG TPA: hypothetical protein PLS49_01310 [Candidatus Woesebacteria bacterium]|nr:hypothetical protein [Candidatus Woesebacteria bacterium]